MLSKTIKLSIVLLCLLALAVPSNVGSAAGEILPFAGAPECPDINHDGHADVTDNVDYGKFPDNQLYHDLWNERGGCHSNHEHGDSPYLANKYFGSPGALWGGQTIAYPFTSGYAENAIKHDGYKWVVRTPEYHAWPPCGASEQNDLLINRSDFCVMAVRAQVHISTAMDMFVRYHSGFLEVYACRPPYRDPQDCGVFKMGSSLVDWGQPRSPFYQTFRPRPFPGYDQPTFTVDFGNGAGGGMVMNGLLTDSFNYPDLPGKSGEPYVNVQPETPANLAFFRNMVPASGQQIFTEFWSSNDYDCEPRPPGDPCHNQYFHLAVTIMDSWFLLDPQDMRSVDFICQPGQPCHYNGSLRGLNEAGIRVLPEWDSKDGATDSFVTWKGYTDRFGNPREGCTSAGSDCVPFEMIHAPVGVGQKHSGIDCGCMVWEYDNYFNGQPSNWIQFNVHGSHSPEPATPVPTNTPISTPPSSGPFVSTDVNPASLNIGGTALVSVNLNNVPAEGYKSAEFTCTYNAGLIEKNNIVATDLFGADPVVAVHDPQNGTFIVAVAGTNNNRATTSGPAFTFSAKGLQAGQSQIQCTARVSKGDNMPIDLPSTGASLTVLGVDPSPTPLVPPTSTPEDHMHPTATSMPLESPTPAPTLSPNGALGGQVIASKPVTVSLLDASNVVITTAVANPDGTFIMTPLAGNYTLVATASGFLSHQGSVTITAGNTIILPPSHLLAGDVDGNNVIDQFDALTIGMSYKSSAPAAADLNNDGVIDFLDLELLAENYRKTGPSAW
jgi:hypothetical protein